MNPFGKSVIAAPKPNLKVYRFLVKLILPIYIVTDYTSTYAKYFEVSVMSVYLILLFLRFQTLSFYNTEIDNFMVSCDLLLVWVACCGSIQAVSNIFKK